MSIRDLSVTDLVHRVDAGDRRALGRLLTVVEQFGDESDTITELTHGASKGAHIVGITGAPGSGKSTLVGALLTRLAETGRHAAVLAVDPSSPLTGGAILGDRVRMPELDGVFIRSIATRGHAGGLALSIPGCVRVFDAAGYSPIIVETVGVGQVEVDVTAAADTTVVIVTPGMGDAVQANKAGLLEVADIFVVNKADQPGADDTRRDLELMLDLSHMTGQEKHRPPILMTAALDGSGVEEVIAAIGAHQRYLIDTGSMRARRINRARFEVESRLMRRCGRAVDDALGAPEAAALLREVADGRCDPATAARRISIL